LPKKTEIVTVNPYKIENSVLKRATQIIKEGGVVSFPTETVYALGADACNLEAVKKVYKLKKRERNKPLSMFVRTIHEVKELVERITPEVEKLMKSFWPGPLTLIFQTSRRELAPILCGGNKLGLRISSSPLIQTLLESSEKYLTATSANVSGKRSCLYASQVFYFFTGRIELILDGGKSATAYTSTILDVSGEEVVCLRKGLVPLERIKEIVPEIKFPVETVSPF
jgi:L-threonylcarbamoyladenylate synthase